MCSARLAMTALARVMEVFRDMVLAKERRLEQRSGAAHRPAAFPVMVSAFEGDKAQKTMLPVISRS